jgi:hypothetical protein
MNSTVTSIGQTCLEYQRTWDNITIGCGEKMKTAWTHISGEAILLELQLQATYDVIAYFLNSSMTQLYMYLLHIPFVYHTPGSIWYT